MPEWVWAVPAVVVLLVVVDRLMAHSGWPAASRRPRAARPGGGGGSGAFGEIVAAFAPSVRHLHEESERQKHDLVQPGDADPEWDLDLAARGAARRTSEPDAAALPLGVPTAHACRLVPVTAGVWTATASTWSSVTTLVVADDGGCLVVDPNVTPVELVELADEVAAHGWRVVAGFSTHPHWDHVLWSAGLGDVPRWATVEAVQVATGALDTLAADADAVAPGHDHTRTGRLTPVGPGALAWSGPRAVVVPYPGHCPGSAALHLPDTGVLLAGDALSDCEVPLLAPSSAGADPLADYRLTLDLLEALLPTVGSLVPGHGTVCDNAGMRERLAADRSYLQALAEGVPSHDPRLVDPEQAEVHGVQTAQVHGGER